jgi:uncharacterized protein (TIGR02646 family)
MLGIKKGKEPACMVALRTTPGAKWSSVGGKEKRQIVATLHTEQRGLCAYCMGALRLAAVDQEGNVSMPKGAATVEHWHARSDGGSDFDWRNLLAVCDGGGEGVSPRDAHCDRRKQGRKLAIHPADGRTNVEQLLKFRGDGRVEMAGAGADELYDDPDRSGRSMLNLNHPNLVASRKAVVDVVLAIRNDPKRVKVALARHSAKQGELPPFAQVGRIFLQRAKARLKAIKESSSRPRAGGE